MQGRVSSSTGPETMATVPKGGTLRAVVDRFEDHVDDLLDELVPRGWDAPSTLPPHPNRLRDSSPSPIPTIRSADNGSRSSGSAGELIRISSSDSRMDGT